nr:amidohydrolase family protein [Microbacterium sp. SCN 71-17]
MPRRSRRCASTCRRSCTGSARRSRPRRPRSSPSSVRSGVERVVLGSDFPWYTPGATAAVVEELPGLSASEAAAIIGENAARLLRLG